MSRSFSPDAVNWPRCFVEVAQDTQCTGIQVGEAHCCLAHLDDLQLDGYFSQLGPGANVDARGVSLDLALMNRLRAALSSTPDGKNPQFGETTFRGATFTSGADFRGATFTLSANFDSATFLMGSFFEKVTFTDTPYFGGVTFGMAAYFSGVIFANGADFTGATFAEDARFGKASFTQYANFGGVTVDGSAEFADSTFTHYAGFRDMTVAGEAKFSGAIFSRGGGFKGVTFGQGAEFIGVSFAGGADFDGATFTKDADFLGVTFAGHARFDDAVFGENALFGGVTFGDRAEFGGATFTKNADFPGATFTKEASLRGARFEEIERLGPLAAGSLDLDRASFGSAVVVEVEAVTVSCRRARFTGGAELRVRYGTVDLSEAFFGPTSSLSTSSTPFVSPLAGGELQIVRMSQEQAGSRDLRFGSLDHRPMLLSLRGVDVTELALTDVDLRWCRFAGANHLDKLHIEGDSTFPRPPRSRWLTSRQVLFDEHPWRSRRRHRAPWHAQVPGNPSTWVEPVGATRLVALYRSLRKALEDGKNEAGAGDFYYGEQEARRHSTATSRSERAILWLYWLISGYGQRASRAVVALAVLVSAVTVLLVGTGLPDQSSATQSTTTVQSSTGGQRTVTTITDVPVGLSPDKARWTWSRAESAVRIALGAVVFRDAGQKLTPPGTGPSWPPGSLARSCSH